MYFIGFLAIENTTEIYNVAKRNLTSKDWIPMENLDQYLTKDNGASAAVSASIPGSNATVFVVGPFWGEFNSIAGCDNEGNWVDNALKGFTDLVCNDILYDADYLYILCYDENEGTVMQAYNGYQYQQMGSNIQIAVNYNPKSLPSNNSESSIKSNWQ